MGRGAEKPAFGAVCLLGDLLGGFWVFLYAAKKSSKFPYCKRRFWAVASLRRLVRPMRALGALAFAAASLVAAETPVLRWGDVMSQVRRQNAVGEKQAALPFDFDAVGFLFTFVDSVTFAPSTRASSGRVVTDAGTTTPERTPASPPEQVAGLAERRSKRSAVVRLASAPLLDVDDEPLSP